MSSTPAPRPNYESASWEKLTPRSRRLVAAAAGFTNEFQLKRIGESEWADLFDGEHERLYRIHWATVIARQERKKR